MPPAPLPKAGDIVAIRCAKWAVTRVVPYGETAVIEVIGAEPGNRGERAGFLLPFEPCQRVGGALSPQLARPARWRRAAVCALSAAVPAVDALRTVVRSRIALLPFQLEPALAVLGGDGCRVLIADEVGLGKTIQAGVIVAETLERTADGRALIVTPASLREQWQTELAERLGLDAALLDAAALARAGSGNPWAAHPIVIASIDFLKRPDVLRPLEALIWDVVVFDEAHLLTGRSERAAAAQTIAERARAVVALTATPHSGDDGALHRLCEIGNLRGQFPLLLFRRTRADAGLPSARRMRWMRIRPVPAELLMHDALLAYARRVWNEAGAANRAARLAMAVLVRRACSSAAALVRSIERRLALIGSPASAAGEQVRLPFASMSSEDDEPADVLMAPGLRDALDERAALERVLALARVAARAESKLAALGRLLRRTGERAIVFTEYRDTLDLLQACVTETSTCRLHGGLTASERRGAIQAFASRQCRVLLATDAASEGLNLHQDCRLVINLELPWTPLRLEQRIGRVERIGQPRRVHAVNFIAAGTSEELTVARLHRRLQRMGAALRTMEAGTLTEEDVSRAAIGREPLADAVPPGALPAGVRVADLRAKAAREAARIAVSRIFAAHARCDVAPRRRPAMTVLRRARRGRYWLIELPFTTGDHQPLWTLLLAVHGEPPRTPASSPADVKRLLDISDARLASVIHAEGGQALEALRRSLEARLTLAARRERAIAGALRARHARMSALLLQPRLFDRRSERAAAAQAAIASEALERCARQLDRIARTRAPVANAPALICAALVR